MTIKSLMDVNWKQKRIKAIDRLSKMRGWIYDDTNPYFDEVWTFLPKSNAKNLLEYKKNLKIEKLKFIAEFTKQLGCEREEQKKHYLGIDGFGN